MGYMTNFLSKDCSGRYMNDAFNYIKEVGGLMKNRDYDFKGIKNKFKIRHQQSMWKVKGNVNMPTIKNKWQFLLCNMIFYLLD